MTTIQELIGKTGELSPLPPTAPKLAQVVARENSTVDEVAEVLQYDQALTLDILKYANSAMSASSRTIATVKEAVIRLGGARILERIVARHVKTAMQAPLGSYGYTEKELWRHSVAAAGAAEQLGGLTRSPVAGLSFTAALLHDIGKLILGRTLPPEAMEPVVKRVFTTQPAVTFDRAEYEVFGFSHADIGAEIAGSWQLPEPIVEAIRRHHTHDDTGGPVTDAVKISNIVARSIGEGLGHEGMGIAIDSALAARTGISREQFEMLCATTSRRLAMVLSMFEM